MLINPYRNVNFSDALRIPSVSHAHTRVAVQEGGSLFPASEPGKIQMLYNRGIRHFAISNYRPSAPTYPLIEHWSEKPSDAIGCPNAEYYDFTRSTTNPQIYPLHANCIGGTLTNYGMNVPWNVGFLQMLDTLILSDGGGITINHPYYSGTPIPTDVACAMLDLDDRVLGIEVYNGDANTSAEADETPMWDEILLTGRRCWGFGVPDWGAYGGNQWKGRNILLVSEATENACLRAYRNGEFYVAYYGSGLTFTSIEANDAGISVATNGASAIHIFVDGVKTEYATSNAVKTFSSVPIYARVEAFDQTGERIMSQPFIFRKPDNTDEAIVTIMSES
jgi:hypothetical protein